jgi:pilus assembly protein CpaB
MRPVLIILIVVALAIAGVTAFLVNRFLSETEEAARNVEPQVIEEQTVDILVTADTLEVGKIVRDEDLVWQRWPENAVNPNYIVKGPDNGVAEIEEFIGSAVRVEMVSGEPIVPSKVFRRGEAGFLSGVLTPGMRAVTIAVSAETGTGGFVLPGDHVDVMVVFDVEIENMQTGDTKDHTVGETVLEDVRVLAIDQRVAADTSTEEAIETLSDVVETVTLEVTPNQAQSLAVADSMGRLNIALRSRVEGEIAEAARPYSPDYVVSRFLGGTGADGTVPVAADDFPIYPEDETVASNNQVRVYRSTTAQDLMFSGNGTAIP